MSMGEERPEYLSGPLVHESFQLWLPLTPIVGACATRVSG